MNAYLSIGFLLVRCPAMALVIAPAVVAAGRPWIRILRRYRGRAAVRDLCLVGFVGTLFGLGRSRDLVHTFLRPTAVTGAASAATATTTTTTAAAASAAAAATAGVMHRRRPLSRTTSRLTSPHHHLLPAITAS